MNPNAKISDSYLPAIESKFGDEQKLKQDSEKVAIKLKEIIEMGNKKKTVDDDAETGVKEVIIKSNLTSEASTGPAPQPAQPAQPVQSVQPAPVQWRSPKRNLQLKPYRPTIHRWAA